MGLLGLGKDTAFYIREVLLDELRVKPGAVNRRLTQRLDNFLAGSTAVQVRVAVNDVRIVCKVHPQHFPTHFTLIEDHLRRSVGGLIDG